MGPHLWPSGFPTTAHVGPEMGCCFYSNSLINLRGSVASQPPTAWLLSPRGPWELAALHNPGSDCRGQPPASGTLRVRDPAASSATPTPGCTHLQSPPTQNSPQPGTLQGLSTPQRRASAAQSSGKGSQASTHLQGCGPVQLLGLLQPQGDHGDSDTVTRTRSSKCRLRPDPAVPKGHGVYLLLLP